MSFRSPLVLPRARCSPPLGVARYVAHGAAPARGGARVRRPARSRPSVRPRRPGWRRHVPLALVALAHRGAVVALARPQVSVAVPAEQASIVLAMDHSGSMQATDVAPSRLVAAPDAGEAFLDARPRAVRVGGVVFNHRAGARCSADDGPRGRCAPRSTGDGAQRRHGHGRRAAARSGLLERSAAPRHDKPPPAAIVLLSDGTSTCAAADPVEVARKAADQKVPIYTVALGTDGGHDPGARRDGRTETERVPPDKQAMRQVAQISGGQTFGPPTPTPSPPSTRSWLQVGTQMEERQVTAWWAGGAVALLAVGAALSLAWFGRLP